MIWLWIFPAVVFILLILGAAAFLHSKGGLGFPWIQFYTKGKESGFQFAEIHTLRRAVVEAALENPVSIFSSVKQLDRTIRGVIIHARAALKTDDPGTNKFLVQLFDFRKRVEFNLPKYRLGIKSTRDLMATQRLRLTLPNGGSFVASLVENLRKYLAISYPVGPALPPGFTWKNQKVNVYFWRAEDAGYYFESRVIDDFLDRKFPIIYITHSDNLIRSQKRRSIRVETNLPCSIYNLATIQNANEMVEKTAGYRARLVDVSEDGCALLVGGKAKVGLPIKVQFKLSEDPLVMSGIIKGITFDEKKNRSILHIQAVPLSPRLKNSILTYVYNIFDERTEQSKRGPAAFAT